MKTVLENPWIIALVTGLIVTIVGGIILNKILKNKQNNKQSFELKNDGDLEVDKDLVVGSVDEKESSQSREHKVKLGADSKTVVKKDFIVGSKNKK